MTLVHGTWAMTSRWTRPDDSEFVEKLRQELADRGETAVFHRFLWSGGNTFAARKTAQDDLAIHIDEVATKHPGVRHYVVSHSHGGNVALATVMAHKGPVRPYKASPASARRS